MVRFLGIDPCDIFYPETTKMSPMLKKLKLLTERCTEQEIEAIIPVIEVVLSILRGEGNLEVNK